MRRLSIAGVVLVIVWLLIQGNVLLNRAEDQRSSLERQLQDQANKTEAATAIATDIQRKLDAAIAQNEVLSQQILLLGGRPIVVTSPNTSQNGSGSSSGGSGGSPPPTTAPAPPGGPNNPPPNPPPQPSPGLLDPICDLTSVLNLC